ncbi:MAG: hypothetical protein AB7N80_09640 [Bdellovibrionales bacterium]
MKPAERRIAHRKTVDSIAVAELTSLNHYKVLARAGQITDASTSGLQMTLERKDLVPRELRENLSLQELVGQQVVMFLPQMNLDLDGVIMRAEHVGRGTFVLGIQFSEDVPLYWRECLIDLLPAPGEIEDETTGT